MMKVTLAMVVLMVFVDQDAAQGPDIQCTAGSYSLSGSGFEPCDPCLIGSYSDIDGATSCTPCAQGETTAAEGATDAGKCIPDVPCAMGFHSPTGSEPCLECDFNFYADQPGMTSCTPCAAGETTLAIASTDITDCQAPVLCSAGYYSISGNEPCTECSIGQYQDMTGQLDCLPCPAGQTTTTTGATQCDDIVQCVAGSYSFSGNEPCDPCDVGFYQDQSGQTTCVECPNGLTTLDQGADSDSQCQ